MNKDMNKKEYIEKEILELNYFLSKLLLFPYGVITILLLSFLDYLVTPENFIDFFKLRIITSLFFICLFLVLKFKKGKVVQTIVTFLAALSTAAMVEIMILSFGGYQSSYYAGMILILVFILGFLPLSLKMSIVVSSLIYLIYLVPIIVIDNITNVKLFINNNFFLLSFALGGFAWRYYNNQLLIKKLSLEYDLAQEKERLKEYSDKLEEYSRRLEDMVAERTKELVAANKKYAALFEHANDGVLISDVSGKILDANHKFCELFEMDKSQLIGIHFWNLEHEKDDAIKLKRFEKLLSGKAITYETQYVKSEDKKMFLDVSSKMIEVEGAKFIQSLYRDITEKKLLQEQLLQAQKMESIGILASGVAHDFNNLLTASLGHIELLLQFGGLDENLKEKMKIIENSIRKAGNLVSKLLSFARKEEPTFAPVNLNQVVRDAVEMVEKVGLKKKVDFKIEIDHSINLINGDGNQLEQMLMNLLVNAIDAMPHGGVLTVRTSNLNIKQKSIFPTSLLEPGNYVVVTVSDTGTGIPEHIRDKIFEPFFTTKEKGKGTGLGLPMVHGIVKAHNGLINVISEEGRGTTFEIFFPACGTLVECPEKSIVISTPKLHNIMLVDDERDLLNSLKELLEKNGYRVFATDNPAYAADIFQDIYDNIDLVITDISMPLFDGVELIYTIKNIAPSVKVITISAHDHRLEELKSLKIVDGYMKKPFEINSLLNMIRNVLSKNSII